MSMALNIRVDGLAREVGELRQRVQELERAERQRQAEREHIRDLTPDIQWRPDESVIIEPDDTNAAVEGDDFAPDQPKRRGRPRKQS